MRNTDILGARFSQSPQLDIVRGYLGPPATTESTVADLMHGNYYTQQVRAKALPQKCPIHYDHAFSSRRNQVPELNK